MYKRQRQSACKSGDRQTEIVNGICQAVSQTADARCRFVGLAAPRSLPKTTSGKLRRIDTRRLFESDQLKLIAPLAVFDVGDGKSMPNQPQAKAAMAPLDGPLNPAAALDLVMEIISDISGFPIDDITPEVLFSDLGIDSLAAVDAMLTLGERTGVAFSPSDLFNLPTIEALATAISARTLGQSMGSKSYVVLNDPRTSPQQTLDPTRTVFCLPPGGGHVFAYVHLAQHMKSHTLVAFENRSASEQTPIDQLVAQYLQQIRELQPRGPWQLVGYSLGGVFGGLVAKELVDCSLVLVDGLAPNHASYMEASVDPTVFETTAHVGRRLAVGAGQMVVENDDVAEAVEAQIAWDLFSASQVHMDPLPPLSRSTDGKLAGTYVVQLRAPAAEDGVRGTLLESLQDDPNLGWSELCTDLESRVIAGGHFSVVGPDLAKSTARAVLESLEASPYAKSTVRARGD